MSDQETEYFFTCPYCWQQISIIIDLSTPTQHFVEDCEVCCQPIDIRYTVSNNEIVDFEATITN